MYKTQIACIIIVAFIGLFRICTTHKRNLSSKWFSTLQIVSFFQLFFDVVSVYTVNHLTTVPAIINRLVHNAYLGMMITIFYIVYQYLETIIEEEIGKKVDAKAVSATSLVLINLGVFVLPLHYVETPKGNYSYGFAAFMAYVGVVVYVTLIIRLLIRYRKEIPAKKKWAMEIALGSEIPIAIYQMLFPTSLVTCIGLTLLNLGIYLTTENPDALLVEKLEKETKRADMANQAKTNFLANMSHEIRTPINAVLGMNEMIFRESTEPNVKEYAKDVAGAAKSLLSIINDILDITKIEAGMVTIIPVEYDFSSVAHDVINMITFKANEKGLEFITDIDEDIPSVLNGDDVRLRQILVNLLGNAVKYTHKGTVTLEIKKRPCEEEGQAMLFFSVKDTGIGIKDEDIEKLCVPFQRVDEKKNRSIEGTGLGMSITKQLLSMLDSKLTISSVYGEGSEFSFELKQKIVNPEPIGKLGARVEAARDSYEHTITYEAPDARILVVDDSEMNRRVLKGLLKETKVQITEAASGRECLEKVKNTAFDLIFMDHMMPELDGIETFHMMQEMEDYPCKDTPVVILTANAIAGAKEKYLSEGFSAFLSKPIDYVKLEKMVKKQLKPELIHEVSESDRAEAAKKESTGAESTELPMIDGLDWKYASAHFRDEESMLDMIKLFYTSLEYEAAELEELLRNVQNEEGCKEYRVKVHSMKNAAGTIGIIPLSGMAKMLEDAARNMEREVLYQMTPVFLSYWRKYKERLKPLIGTEEEKSADENEEELQAILVRIKNAAEEMDIDALDHELEELEKFHFEGERAELMESIKKAIINFDVEYLQGIPVEQ